MITTSIKETFFEVKLRVEKTTEDGTLAKFNELYVVNAQSFTEAEAKSTEYISQYTNGEFEVLTEARAKYGEIHFIDDEEENAFWKVRLDFITLDERTYKTKHSKCDVLVQGSSVESVKKNIDEVLKDSMVDYKIVSVGETVIQDYIA